MGCRDISRRKLALVVLCVTIYWGLILFGLKMHFFSVVEETEVKTLDESKRDDKRTWAPINLSSIVPGESPAHRVLTPFLYVPLNLKTNPKSLPAGKFRTNYTGKSLLIYNRVPKCASDTVRNLLFKKWRHRDAQVDRKYWNRLVRLPQFPEFCRDFRSLIKSTPYDAEGLKMISGHFYRTELLEMCSVPEDEVVWINQLRHPVERFISSFHFHRLEVQLSRRFKIQGAAYHNFKNKNFTTCVLTADPECDFRSNGRNSHKTEISFFCGHAQECELVGNRQALQKAKQVVEQDYAAVGIQEELGASIELYERVIPQFFHGAKRMYDEDVAKGPMMHKTSHDYVSQEVKDILHRNMSVDIEFYEFVRARFYTHLDFYKIPHSVKT